MLDDASFWLNAMPDAVLVIDTDGVVVHANRHCEALLGWSPEALCGKQVEELIPARHGNHVELRQGYMANPSLRAMGAGRELAIVDASGAELHVDIALNPLTFEGRRFVVATLRDVREQYQLTERLRAQSVALSAAASGVVITDKRGVITWVNPAACRITGYAAEDLIGQHTRLLKSGQHEPGFYAELWATVLAGETWHGAIVNRRRDGTLYHEDQTIAPVRASNGAISHFIAIKQDVTDRIVAEQALRDTRDELTRRVAQIEALHGQLREQAIRDPLTGLYNRRYLDETLPRELAKADRDRTPVTLALLDIDHFKQVNDRYGHSAGDRVLERLGSVLRSRSRTGDIACRYGGEEFVVMLIGARLDHGLHTVQTWRQVFANASAGDTGPLVHATISAGVAEWLPGESAAELFTRADGALYSAKDAGRDRVIAADAGPVSRVIPPRRRALSRPIGD